MKDIKEYKTLKPNKNNKMAKVAIIGSGGREHALGWSISQDADVSEVLYFKGNPGTGLDEKCRNIGTDGSKKENFEKIADFVDEEGIDMVVVGPEQPLVDGVVDFFNSRGYNRIFGPSSKASAIEADKFFSYDIMEAALVPQAFSIKVNADMNGAESAIEQIIASHSPGVVIKARGLTAGKGVYVCDSRDKEVVLAKLREHIATFKGDVLLSEKLLGPEFSVFGISDGERVIPLEMSVQDHKRLLTFDKGPNTGGMGAYGPVPIANSEMVRKVADEMMTPVVRKMKERGIEYRGFLYAGVMISKKSGRADQPKILEFNCRFGDPEAQPSVMMLDGGLYKPLAAALEGRLDNVNFKFKQGAACCVVLASNGYPGNYEKGLEIGGLKYADLLKDDSSHVKVFHAGTAIKDGKIVTAGGRVLGVTAYSPEGIRNARAEAYLAAERIDNATTEANNKRVFIYRADIASKAL